MEPADLRRGPEWLRGPAGPFPAGKRSPLRRRPDPDVRSGLSAADQRLLRERRLRQVDYNTAREIRRRRDDHRRRGGLMKDGHAGPIWPVPGEAGRELSEAQLD